MTPTRTDLVALYELYLACCNDRRLDELDGLVADDVGGSGAVDGRAGYVQRVEAVLVGFPDYRWDLQDLVVEADTVVARLTGRGTHTGPFEGVAPTGRRVEVQELVVYRFGDGRITGCWGDLFPVLRDALADGVRTTG